MECRATPTQKVLLIGLLAGWAVLMVTATGITSPNAAPPLLIRVSGWLGLIGTAFVVPFAVLVFSRRPVVLLSDAGIDDARLGVGVIPWLDITSVSTLVIRNRSLIQLWLRNERTYLGRWSTLRRMTGRIASAMGYSPFSISLFLLTPGFKPVFEYISRHVEVRTDT